MVTTLDTSIDIKAETPSRDNIILPIKPMSFEDEDMNRNFGLTYGYDENLNGRAPTTSPHKRDYDIIE
mgnify:CR=1 FL=1